MQFMCAKILQFSYGAYTHNTTQIATYYSNDVEAVGNDICDVVRVYFQACHGFWVSPQFFLAPTIAQFCILHEISKFEGFVDQK